MYVGLMEGTIRRDTLSKTLDATVGQGIHHLQYHISPSISAEEVRKEMDEHGIQICGIIGNIQHD